MNYQTYLHLFENILNNENPPAPYNDANYFNYTKLNFSRMKRWNKTMELDEQLVQKLKALDKKQHWIIITEPWCGDAAHIVPFLLKLAAESEFIEYDLQLRDSEPFLIDSYLTNGTKSIPKLIVRDEQGNDIFTWGPRPKEAQALMEKLNKAEADFETIKMELQTWYNKDKGKSLFAELQKFY